MVRDAMCARKSSLHEAAAITIPRHESLRVDTLADVLGDATNHVGLTREALVERLFGR